VLAGLVEVPVVAVPTSVGYGTAFNGIAPLLTALNACAPGVAVVSHRLYAMGSGAPGLENEF